MEADVDLLLSKDNINVFLAGNRLLQLVTFLSSYSATTREAIQSSAQYNALANAIEFRAIKPLETT